MSAHGWRHGGRGGRPAKARGHGPKEKISGAPAGAGGRAQGGARTMVAVLERGGRFLTAEPLFPPRQPTTPGSQGRGRGGPGRVVVRAGGPGRGASTVRASAGDLVLVELARKGSGAFVTRVIGRPEVARNLIEAMMLDRGLARGFAPSLEAEAREAEERVRRLEGGRRDLRELSTFTIDPVSARDFDDAISAESMSSGGTRVWVHIADVAAHVPEGSPLDLEARRRGTSVYVPGAVEPMLPHALSSGACSLMPHLERAAVTVEMELEGSEVRRASFYRSLIRSDARLDYEQVDRIFAGAERGTEPWGASLAAARVAAAALQDRRERSGALVVDSEEPEFTFDEEGNVTGIEGRVQTESHRLIEHLMITANEAVAAHLQERGAPCLYRVHERPDPERIERLADQLATLEVPTPPIPENMSSTQAAELVGLISGGVAEHVARTGRGRIALNSLILRSLKQAYYSPENLGHAGLQSPCYCHFTSPIRRYPDLVCHRALLAGLAGGEPAPRARDMAELGVWTSEREREAMTIERDGDDMARAFALRTLLYEGDPDRGFDGEITGLIPAGAFIAFSASPLDPQEGEQGTPPRVSSPPFEGMLPVRMMALPIEEPERRSSQRSRRGERGGGGSSEREWWELNEAGTILRGERTGASIRLGDEIQVRVARVDTVRGRVDLLPAG